MAFHPNWRLTLSRLVTSLVLAAGAPALSAAPFAYVTNQGDDTVSVVDLANEQVAATVPVGGEPAGIAVSQDGKRIYVTNPKSKDVYLIDGTEHRVLRHAQVGEGSLGIALGPDAKRVYIASWFSNELLVMDVRTLEVVGSVPTGESPRAFGVFLARGGRAERPHGHRLGLR